MLLVIDPDAGFCFGVDRAIRMAEETLADGGEVFALGEMVHNESEMDRLHQAGLTTIDAPGINLIEKGSLIFRAHGEPPSSYEAIHRRNIPLVDATCPIVESLRKKIQKAWEEGQAQGSQVVLFGKANHPETIGLNGFSGNNCTIISQVDDISRIDLRRPVELFSQTTMDASQYAEVAEALRKAMQAVSNPNFKVHRSVCGQVSGRGEGLKKFATDHEVILFVAGQHSANGAYLYSICQKANPHSYKISSLGELDFEKINHAASVGITGATSTPRWLLKAVADELGRHFGSDQY